MIGYSMVGTNDLEKAKAFYGALLGEMGAKVLMDVGRGAFYGVGMGKPMLGVAIPFNKEAATIGNGTMVALHAETREQVDAVYAKALELGGTDEGAPGERFPGFYAGYFRDLDGNKLNCCYMGQ